MYVKKKLILWAAIFALAIPLLLVGTASAEYRSDGAAQNATSGAWEIADPGQCYVKDSAITGHTDSSATGRTACRAIISSVTSTVDCAAYDDGTTTPGNKTWWKGRVSGTTCTGEWVYNTNYVANSGANSAAGDREGCLHCHNAGRMEGTSAGANTSSFMQNGHKNMLRKVTVNQTQLGPDGLAYTTDGTNTYNWTNGTITSPTGTVYNLLWIYGDWIAPTPTSMYLAPEKNMAYTCSRCHATGTSIDSSANMSKEPFVSFPSLSTQIGSGNGQLKLALGVTGYSGNYASWDQWGIQCSRCHNSASVPETAGLTTESACTTAGYRWLVPSHGSPYCTGFDAERVKWNPDLAGTDAMLLSVHAQNPADGAGIVRLCGECHRQETGGLPYTWVGSNNGTAWDKGFGDHAETVIAGLNHVAPSPAISHNYMNVFLNSPHGKFSGTYGQITNMANYASTFMTPTTAGGLDKPGCLGCHNIHNSLAVEGQEPFENECTTCHTTDDGVTPQVEVAMINHPTGTGTPLENAGTEPWLSCEICHMPQALHFMRINVNPAYSTMTGTATQPANTAADGTYTPAIWVDLDLACGQCHDGATAADFTKEQMAVAATAMHSAATTTVGRANSDCLTCHTSIVPGTNHHGVHSTCVGCHAQNHSTAKPDASDNSYCLGCHGNTGTHAHHHVTAAIAAASLHCNGCHTPGVAPTDYSNTACMSCHNATWATTAGGTVRAVVQGTDHHNGTCTTCHEEGGAYLAINAMTAPTLTTTLKPAGSHNPLPYWSIDTSLRTGCLSCHSTPQPKLAGGMTGTIINSGAGDNHHGGHSSVPGTNFGGVSEANGSRGDNDPGMACVGCHGKGAIVSGDNATGYTVKIVASGLPTSVVAAQNGRVNTTGLCLGCHEVIQSGSTQDHHAGDCLTCHHADGSWSGTYGAGVGTATVAMDANSRDSVVTSCQQCHATTQGSSRAIVVSGTGDNHHRGSGTSTARSVASCLYCHGHMGGVPFGTASTEVIVDAVAPGSCSGSCHASSQAASGTHHTGEGLTPVNGILCFACHNTTQADGRGPGAPGVTDSTVWPPATWVDCTACHSSGGPNGPATTHHVVATGVTCEECHAHAGVRPTVPALATNSRDSVVAYCQTCHATAQGTSRALIVSGTGDNHHRGSGTTTARSVASCLYCHGAGGGLPYDDPATEVVQDSVSAGKDSSCQACHSVVQSGTTKNHHAGPGATASSNICMTCHVAGQPGAPGVTDIALWPPVTWVNCTGCHTAGEPTGPSTTSHVTHSVNFTDGANCETCHAHAGVIPTSAEMSVSCETCHAQTMSNLSHAQTPSTPQNCGTCHASAGSVPTILTACNACHTPDDPFVANRFSAIHNGSLPRPNFTWSNSATTPLNILFSAAASTHCTSYEWNFGDGTGGSGMTTNHTYALKTAQTVTLTCADGSSYASISKAVWPREAAAPAITPAANVVTDGYHVTLTDTTVASGMTGTITIMWGDGQRSYIRMGGEADHLYRRARTYNVMMMLRTDTPGYRVEASRAKIPVTIERLIISGLVTKPGGTTPFPGVIMTLKHNGNTLKKAVTNSFGAYTFRNVVPNVVLETYPTPTTYSDYTIEALKRTGRLVSDGTTTTREVYSWLPSTITTTVTTTSVTVSDFVAEP